MQKPIVILVVLLVAFGTQAQTKSRTKTTRPQETRRPTPASLSIEAAVIYESGDVKPVARTQFILLDEDLNTILKPFPSMGHDWEARPLKPLTPFRLGNDIENMLSVAEQVGSYAIPAERAAELKAEVEEIQKTIAAHTVASVTTDFSGKATFEGVAQRGKFIYGRFKAGRNELSWHMPVEVKPGANATLTLSNDNSLRPTAKDVF